VACTSFKSAGGGGGAPFPAVITHCCRYCYLTHLLLLLLLKQIGSDLLVKAVLQAFQMSLSCCMERSHLPMMKNQLVLRLMAAAQAATATAAAAAAASTHPARNSIASPTAAAVFAAAPREGSSNESLRSRLSQQQHQEQYMREMAAWFERQYKQCWAKSSLVWQQCSGPNQQQQQQSTPPHLMGYTPSLTQAGGRHRMALRGHLGPIRQVVITADGKDVLTASDDGGVQASSWGW
jgi:hypothetical protein